MITAIQEEATLPPRRLLAAESRDAVDAVFANVTRGSRRQLFCAGFRRCEIVGLAKGQLPSELAPKGLAARIFQTRHLGFEQLSGLVDLCREAELGLEISVALSWALPGRSMLLLLTRGPTTAGATTTTPDVAEVTA